MATIIRMPAVSAGSDEAAIQTWLVAPGQTLTVGQPLAEIETEKAVVEYAAEIEGTVLKLLAAEGVAVNVGDPIAVVGAQGESADDAELGPAASAVAETQAVDGPPVVVETQAVDVAPVVADAPVSERVATPSRQFASPIVRRLAKERGLDLTTVVGSGPGGRVVRRDLDSLPTTAAAAPIPAAPVPASAAASAAAPVVAARAGTVEVPHTGMRRAIARRLTESKSTVPHFYLVADCQVDRLVALRKEVNESSPVKVSLNDFVLKAAAAAFVDVPEANATWGETAVTRYSTVDMSVAVAIDGGLVTPVLRSVESQTLTEIALNVADIAQRARAGQLKQHELEGGSFAVSNLGMYGVTEFSAIINPPQSAILAVGRARPEAVVVDGALEVGTIMTVTLSADHRVLDGALAAQWLAAFVRRIESPLGMLV
ncbi:dihydrolipoamide acetyltransferase family protein [Demequina lutea]|uniref:Dihydrolipoamide acetyltransferase component of pyruvate dehydrogenase complex n=1 Tax=Demequina lutea TaxID=431489 RepID=A0A7Y9Z7H1_9MICO|nr:dihydrolipoamide acetyltransferase family protein [Demequina lutea]NYI40237.1 pyruvate dehydrogenase E2 component (dihydrolipoamide acetyltransferase) [Demequina lutea]